ncbi:MAG: Ldh family oxidoreductase [Spirochaetales bacterium]|uniref:Ldh family oxidoreductase n=1 Tax=Candidatus Thalassospirochaeta sargassi TaxID=3119039 RepID=A0AAJ1IBF7_9SPIO|nr:Ldh family oxidoreductase [Spirochaetales bacterium]
MVFVKVSDVKKISAQILINKGVPEDDAIIIANSIIFAHQRGKGTHGLIRLAKYLKKIDDRLMSPAPEYKIVKDTPAVCLIDAEHGFGQVAASKGMMLGIEKAKKLGISLVGIKDSNNFGTAGFFAEMAVKENKIGIIMGNSGPAIAPWGGSKPLLGTNPIGYGLPGGSAGIPIIMDMATSVAARGKIRLAARNNETIPEGWALDLNGNPTTDPTAAILGSMIPIGGHKGAGLSLVVDILAGMLTGSAFGGDVKPLAATDGFSKYGNMIIVINPEFFLTRQEYTEKIDYLIKNLKECGESVYLPGEKSYLTAIENTEVFEIRQDLFDEVNGLAESLKINIKLTQKTREDSR